MIYFSKQWKAKQTQDNKETTRMMKLVELVDSQKIFVYA